MQCSAVFLKVLPGVLLTVSSVLSCDRMSLVEWSPTFRRIIMSSSSGSSVPGRTLVLLDPQDEVTILCEISRITFPATQSHIPEEWWLVTDSVK